MVENVMFRLFSVVLKATLKNALPIDKDLEYRLFGCAHGCPEHCFKNSVIQSNSFHSSLGWEDFECPMDKYLTELFSGS